MCVCVPTTKAAANNLLCRLLTQRLAWRSPGAHSGKLGAGGLVLRLARFQASILILAFLPARQLTQSLPSLRRNSFPSSRAHTTIAQAPGHGLVPFCSSTEPPKNVFSSLLSLWPPFHDPSGAGGTSFQGNRPLCLAPVPMFVLNNVYWIASDRQSWGACYD